MYLPPFMVSGIKVDDVDDTAVEPPVKRVKCDKCGGPAMPCSAAVDEWKALGNRILCEGCQP